MSRWIDAEHAEFCLQCCGTYHGVIAFDTVKAVLNDAPSIDIVRCKCDFGKCHEQGDTLYESSDWDGGIGFDYIRDIKYCPLCGGLLDGEEQTEREGE